MRAPLRDLTRGDVSELIGALDPAKQAALFRAAGLRVSPRRAGDGGADLLRSRLRGLDDTSTHNVAVALVDILRQALSGFSWDCEDDEVVPEVVGLLPRLRQTWSPPVLHVLFATAADVGAISAADYSAIAARMDEEPPAAEPPAARAAAVTPSSPAPRPEPPAPRRGDGPATTSTTSGPSALDHLLLSAIRRGGESTAVEDVLDLDPTRAASWYVSGFASAWLDRPANREPRTTTLRDVELRGRLAALAERGDSEKLRELAARHPSALERVVGEASADLATAGTIEALLSSHPSRAAALLRRVAEPFPGYAAVLGHAAAVAASLLDDGRIAAAEELLAACDDTVASWSAVVGESGESAERRALEEAAAGLAVRRASCRRRRADFVGATALVELIPVELLDAAGRARLAEERALVAIEVSDPARLRFPATSEERTQMAARLERAEEEIDAACRSATDRAIPHLLAGLLAWCRQEDSRAATELALAESGWPAEDGATRAALGFHSALARARLLEPGTDGPAASAMLAALTSGYAPGGHDLVDAVHALEAHESAYAVDLAVAAFAAAPTDPGAVDALARAARRGGDAAVSAAATVADDERLSLADRFDVLSAAAIGACSLGARDLVDDAVDGVERVLIRACEPALELRWAVSLGTSPIRDAIGPVHADAARIELLRRAGVSEEAATIARRLFHRAAADRDGFLDPHDLLELLAGLGVGEDELASLARLAAADHKAAAPVPLRPVRLLFVGGNEVQTRYHATIDARLASTTGGQVTVEWFTPGWSSNWSQDADRVEGAYPRADALVLMSFVRTLLGRRLRRTSGEAGVPWIACTGHGRASLERAITRAASVVGA